MSSTRKILRTFLASPGDLQEERKAVRDVVAEFNESWADELGYQIELLGWEDTVAGFGRPQHLINQDVDRCALFIGLIWKRWGTLPDKDGKFSSGFHEEFERSIARRENSGSPEIALFFKEIPEQFMEDPGDDLKRVLEFRETVIAERKILFQNFSTIRDMEKLVRKCVAAHVNQVKAADTASEAKEVRTKPADPEPEGEKGKKSPDSSPFSAEGFAFLENFVDRIGREDAMANLSASDVAWFRLLANSISKPGNQEMDLGAHDINILFSARAEGTKLGGGEAHCLAKLGFQHLSNENIPLWCWYSDLLNARFDPALFSSFFGVSDNERVGALSVLSALARELPIDDEYIIKKEDFLNTWFSEKSSARVRSAALEYLMKMGTAEDYAVAKKEYDRSDFGTSRKALECMVGILLRTGQGNSAQQLVLESQFDSLDADILQAVLNGLENVETEKLLRGLEHLNAQVRLRALKVLLGRASLDEERIEHLSRDRDASVRNEAIAALLKLGRSFTEEEVKKILIAERGSDTKGVEFFERYQLDRLKQLPERELTKEVESSLMIDSAAYFARVEKYFAKHVKELRHNIDDTFNAYFEERIQRWRTYFGDSSDVKDLVESTKDLENLYRKRLTRQGLDVLCRVGNRGDLQRIRGNFQDGYAGVSKADAEYLRKYGEWTDIFLLLNVEVGMLSVPQATPLADYYEDFQGEVAKAVLRISRSHPVSELFALEMPAVILKKTVELCAESRFSKISNDTLFKLLYHESPDVRKAASIKVVLTFSAKRIKSILREYVSADKYRYYNVIHWLDLGASMSRDEARKVARVAAGY